MKSRRAVVQRQPAAASVQSQTGSAHLPLPPWGNYSSLSPLLIPYPSILCSPSQKHTHAYHHGDGRQGEGLGWGWLLSYFFIPFHYWTARFDHHQPACISLAHSKSHAMAEGIKIDAVGQLKKPSHDSPGLCPQVKTVSPEENCIYCLVSPFSLLLCHRSHMSLVLLKVSPC